MRPIQELSLRRGRAVQLAVLTMSSLCTSSVLATEFNTGDPDFKLRWDNTVKYSAAWRVNKQDTALLSSANQDDGDRNFSRGVISNRLDLLTELDASYKNFGARISGAAWLDGAYLGRNDNPGFPAAFPNQVSTSFDHFTSDTRDIHGRDGEILDAFVYGKFDLGASRATVRAGKHSLVWGESLFFGANGIAGGMMPVDVVKLASVPSTQFKEAIRPVSMLSGQMQVTPEVTLGAYYQFRWQANRLPAVGSYFASVDLLQDGGEQLWVVPGAVGVPRGADLKARNGGQGGVQLRFRDSDTDYGLYAIRFHDKNPQLVTAVGVNAALGAIAPIGYRLAYHEGITAFGGSFSHTFGDANVAGEISFRRNQDLASSSAAVDASALTGAPANDNRDKPAYAVGRTAHANLSVLWTPPRSDLFPESTLVAELAWNRALSVTKNSAVVAPKATRDAVALRMTFEPLYRQVLPGVDLSVPLGLGYSPKGSRSLALGPGAFPAEGGGDMSVGLNATYLSVWYAGVAYSHFYGAKRTFLDNNNNYTYQQNLKDRDFLSFSIRRTF